MCLTSDLCSPIPLSVKVVASAHSPAPRVSPNRPPIRLHAYCAVSMSVCSSGGNLQHNLHLNDPHGLVCSLQVFSGSSNVAQELPINCSSFTVDSSTFQGSMEVHLRGLPNSQGRIFDGKKRFFQVMVQVSIYLMLCHIYDIYACGGSFEGRLCVPW